MHGFEFHIWRLCESHRISFSEWLSYSPSLWETKGLHRFKGYATIWQLFYLLTLKSLTSYNELFLDLFQMVRVIQFCLRSYPEHIPYFNHGERKHYSWLKLPFSISFHYLDIGKSLKWKFLKLSPRSLGDMTPRKEWIIGVPSILCRHLNTECEQEVACFWECGPSILNWLVRVNSEAPYWLSSSGYNSLTPTTDHPQLISRNSGPTGLGKIILQDKFVFFVEHFKYNELLWLAKKA